MKGIIERILENSKPTGNHKPTIEDFKNMMDVLNKNAEKEPAVYIDFTPEWFHRAWFENKNDFRKKASEAMIIGLIQLGY